MSPAPSKESDFTALWVSAQPVVSSYIAAAVRNHSDAEDLLQEVAQAALSDFESFDRSRPFTPWVVGIARFRILGFFRTQSRSRLVFDSETLESLAHAHEQLESVAGRRLQALQHCLEKLRQPSRQILTLRYWEGQSVAAIAERLEKTPNAISLSLHKSRAALDSCIERHLQREEVQ